MTKRTKRNILVAAGSIIIWGGIFLLAYGFGKNNTGMEEGTAGNMVLFGMIVNAIYIGTIYEKFD